MTTFAHHIMTLMSDGLSRTSYEIDAALWGKHYDNRDWFTLSALCDRMAVRGDLCDLGKNMRSRTVYRKL